MDHKQTLVRQTEEPPGKLEPDSGQSEYDRFSYDRLAAVQYAERWWNSYNPQYRKFDVDCTNYVSQCLRARWSANERSAESESGLVVYR